MDASLRLHLGAVEPDEPVACLVEIDGAWTDAMQTTLEADGLTVRGVVGTVATIQGPPAAIRRAAAQPFIRSLSLSQTRSPLGR